jgi:prevent-host-death family protein
MTVTIHQAKTHLSRLLQQVEAGEEVVVCRGKLPVAKIVPSSPSQASRPKVGKATSKRFDIPADAFAPLGDEELKQWGL